ncbi:DUF4405 domain-containing protein [Candidatus Peregrinibacteria bacterium]|nr:DUF4405 domain-containing protein [Candidatus Peregrinibacteria bacterium]
MKQRWFIIIDILAFAAFAVSLFSGFIMWLVLPYRSGQSGLTFWGWARHDWGDLHLYASLFFAVVVLIHLIVHWKWVKNIPRFWKSGQ